MIRANVILDYAIWKKKIKNPNKYLKNKLKKLSKITLALIIIQFFDLNKL